VRHPSFDPDTPDDVALLDRYLAQEVTPEERARVDAWLTSRPDWRDALGVLQTAPEGDPGEAFVGDMKADIHRLRGVISTEMLAGRQSRREADASPRAWRRIVPQKILSTRGLPLLSFAMIAVLFVVTAIAIPARKTQRIAPADPRTYATSPGQRAMVNLTDGSRVLLGPATTVTVGRYSRAATVDVRVMGEALFTVAHHTDRTFLVRTGNAVVRVLGTTFSVRRYGTDTRTQVVVADGRVAVQGTGRADQNVRNSILVARTMGVIDDSGRVQVVPDIAVEKYLGWTTGQLVFKKTPIREAVTELSRVYGVDIRLADSALASQTLSWTVSTEHRSLTDVLEFLDDVLGTHTIRKGKVITLVRGRAASTRPAVPHSSSTVESGYGR
jgi:transmembrane sensor